MRVDSMTTDIPAETFSDDDVEMKVKMIGKKAGVFSAKYIKPNW